MPEVTAGKQRESDTYGVRPENIRDLWRWPICGI